MDDFRLETERLILRPHREDDAPFMVSLNADPEVVKFTGNDKLSLTEAVDLIRALRRQYMERQMGRFLVVEKKTHEKIGWCGLKWLAEKEQVDLGYRFQRSSWGKGYATESARECLRYGFETLGFSRITARALPENHASVHVLQKLGMQACGRGIESGLEHLFFELNVSAGSR